MSNGQVRARRERGPWKRPEPDRPSCPGCGRAVTLSQPDARKPGQLLGSCDNPACGEWVSFTAVEGRWVVSGRISAEARRNPAWPVARTAREDTARRA